MIQLLAALSSPVINEPFFAENMEQTTSGRCGTVLLQVRRNRDRVDVIVDGKVVGSGYSKSEDKQTFDLVFRLSSVIVDCIPNSAKVRFSGYSHNGELSRYFVDTKYGTITGEF